MDIAEARAALGLGVGASQADAQVAFRRLLQAAHPDRNAAENAADRTRTLVLAYRTIGRSYSSVAELQSTPVVDTADDLAVDVSDIYSGVDSDPVVLVDADTIGLACPSDEAFAVLVEVAHRIGDVTYLDRQSELLEALLRTVDGTTVSMVISLQGRATGITEAFVTLEPIDVVRGELPDVAAVTELVAHHARVLLTGGLSPSAR